MTDELEGLPVARIPNRLLGILDAEDLRQSTLLRFLRSGADLRSRSQAERQAYMRRSLASALGDAIRRENRACRRRDRKSVVMEEITADTSTPSRKAMRNERRHRLLEALEALPPEQRRAIVLHHLQGRSLGETAAAMERTIPSVAGLIRRALSNLKKELTDLGEP